MKELSFLVELTL